MKLRFVLFVVIPLPGAICRRSAVSNCGARCIGARIRSLHLTGAGGAVAFIRLLVLAFVRRLMSGDDSPSKYET